MSRETARRDPVDALVADIPQLMPREPEAQEAARTLVEEARRSAAPRLEAALARRLGWRLMRPLIALALVAAPLSLAQKALPPATALSVFLLGAGAFYALLQVYAYVWERAGRARARRADEACRERLAALRDRLRDAAGSRS
jgi:hypothetical protein